jgi:hypothetical protein
LLELHCLGLEKKGSLQIMSVTIHVMEAASAMLLLGFGEDLDGLNVKRCSLSARQLRHTIMPAREQYTVKQESTALHPYFLFNDLVHLSTSIRPWQKNLMAL